MFGAVLSLLFFKCVWVFRAFGGLCAFLWVFGAAFWGVLFILSFFFFFFFFFPSGFCVGSVPALLTS